jgi:hypothetical protein
MLMQVPQVPGLGWAPVSQTRTGNQRDSDRVRANIAAAAMGLRSFDQLDAGLGVLFGPVGAGGDLVAYPPPTGRAHRVRQSADDGTRHRTEPASAHAPEAGDGATAPALVS